MTPFLLTKILRFTQYITDYSIEVIKTVVDTLQLSSFEAQEPRNSIGEKYAVVASFLIDKSKLSERNRQIGLAFNFLFCRNPKENRKWQSQYLRLCMQIACTPKKKAVTNFFVTACISVVGVDGFEPPTLCL
ncbi:hypothetical protein EZS27_039714 [termite gut metagenome]|uniref:Uncharacterized protein n=1 Tax=termite gut metagenome TaxID=433724 RepID=A0A5J4PIK0_9ZZZZ